MWITLVNFNFGYSMFERLMNSNQHESEEILACNLHTQLEMNSISDTLKFSETNIVYQKPTIFVHGSCLFGRKFSVFESKIYNYIYNLIYVHIFTVRSMHH